MDELTVDEMRAELTRVRKLRVLCDNAGEADGVQTYGSVERALLYGLLQHGVTDA